MANYCIDCDKEISIQATRCKSCAGKAVWDQRGRRWPQENYCVDCRIEISKTATRCGHCANIYVYKMKPGLCARRSAAAKAAWDKKGRRPPNYCADCEKKISRWATRCRSCAATHAYKTTPELCHRTSKRLKAAHAHGMYNSAYRHHGAKLKLAWLRGAFDNRKTIVQFPSGPELNMMKILNELEIEYETQFRIGRYIYDFFLADHNMLIEYDGWIWHHSERAVKQGKPELDAIKNALAMKEGYNLIRLKGSRGRDLTYSELHKELSHILGT